MTPTKPRISEEAAQWAVKIHMRRLTPEEQAELGTWLAADVRHEGALARARAAWLDLDRLAALGAGHVPATQPVHGSTTPAQQRRAGFRGRWRLWAAWAAGIGAVSLLPGIWFLGHTPANTYVSGIGELRKVPLADGSTMLLNTSTEASVHFDDSQRSVHLANGEALFEVAKDSTRPFVVHAGSLTVTAVGTAFVVRTEGDERIEVTVTEGVVELNRPGSRPRVQRIVANERVTVSDSEPIRVEQTPPRDSERRLAWRSGMIAFDNEPLSVAIAEFNRYSPRHIVIDDAELAARPITGIFRTTDIGEFAQTTATALNAEAVNEGEIIRIRPR